MKHGSSPVAVAFLVGSVRSIGCLLALFLLVGQQALAGGPFHDPRRTVAGPDLVLADTVAEPGPEGHKSRALTVGLAVTLGPFGAHRLYLGTTPKVPLIYGLTFGGFGVLVLIDLGHILFTKDLMTYADRDQVFMWVKPREEPVTPP